MDQEQPTGEYPERLPGMPDVPVYALPVPATKDEYLPAEPLLRRRRLLPLVLFLATCASTFLAGANHWQGGFPEWKDLSENWFTGLKYMLGVMGILLAHEMGHFVMTLRHKVPSSFPYFIPMPIVPPGTMGAMIGMHGTTIDRRQVFDIGLAGPLAGLVIAVPLLCLGILHGQPVPIDSRPGIPHLGDPLLVTLLIPWLRPDITDHQELLNNHWLMAAWFGMLLTGLNMMPISQLDGGHVIHGLFGRKSKYFARAFLITAIIYMVFAENYNWVAMLTLVIFMGVDHPPTVNDDAPIGAWRFALGLLSLSIPILCFPLNLM